MKIDHWFKICEKNDDKWHISNIQIKYTIIFIVQYKTAENLPFVVQSHENYDRINFNHSPYEFLTVE